MITCRELIDEFLIQYAEDALPPDEARSFAQHLAVCPSCVAYVESYKRTVQLGRQALDAPPDPVREQVIQAILKSRPRAL